MKAFFQCPNGKYSFSRLAAAVCLFCSVVLPSFAFFGQDIPVSVIGFTASIITPTLAFLYAAKTKE
jgi:hypothetical protein